MPARTRVADQDGLGRAHGQRGAEPGDLSVRGHRDQGHLTPTGGIGELQGHLDAVGVGIVQDELSVTDKVLRPRIERRRSGGIGDLLYTDDDVHESCIVDENRPVRPIGAPSQVRTPQAAGPWDRRAGTPPSVMPSVPVDGPPGQATSSVIDRVHPGRRARRRARHSSATVQAATASPASWAVATVSAVTRASGQVDGGAAEVDGPGHGRGRIEGRDHQEPGGQSGSRRRARRRGHRPERGDDHRIVHPRPLADQFDHVPRAPLGRIEPGLGGQVLDLDVHHHARAGGRERRPGAGRGSGGRRWPVRGSAPTPSITGSWWTASPPSAVSRTSSSTPSAPSARARAKASSVFSRHARQPGPGCPGGPALRSVDSRSHSSQHMTRHRRICVEIPRRTAPKLLATVGAGGYSSERTLNGR